MRLLEQYLDEKGLLLNPTKTQFMLIRRPALPALSPALYLTCKGIVFSPVSTVKYLGILIDEHLTFRPQLEKVCSVVFAKLACFAHGRRNLSATARRTFFLSIIQSTLEYASNAYVHCLKTTLYNRLVTVSHIAMKKAFGLDRMTPTALVLQRCHLYSFEQRVNLKLYVLVYRCLSSITSPLLQSLFLLRSVGPHTNARTRGQDTAALVLPTVHIGYGLRSVSFLAAGRWNTLPPNCRQAQSAGTFAHLTKIHLGFPVTRPCLLGLP